ncbi:HAMP domain-containing sensor histidine kinase [Catenuloplanes atrovinosus]|uniref:histidine kinase n=1 Tax=Catenuloplanes atrovinosus TaxID=137266 RepID=A0AAE3YKY3_9ACTN|nr:HAMP domain-containing sensor histidine kinase [Catenuloplanes atrovinosus]MDR7275719.1 two-component system sensor histidine kinase MtrB [Catenuloplanes atrovinosus]
MTGLRARLLVAFVAVTVLGAAAAAWASASAAGTALVSAAQEQLTAALAGQIGAVAPELTYPPDQASLDRLRVAAGPDTLVTFAGLRAADGAITTFDLGAVRTAARDGNRLVAQRVDADGRPWLLIATPVVITALDGTRTPSGIEVYAARDLTAVDRQVDGLTRSAARTAALALPLAVLLALAAAGSVLRPVRGLRDTARRLAAGDLDARAVPRGRDELTDLTVTINEMAESLARMQADARRFAADASHELRTPLATLAAVVDVLESATADLEPDARESARMAITEVGRLTRLVEDLVEVSRFDAGTARLRVEEADLVGTIRDCLRARGWTSQVTLDAPAELRMPLDRRRVDVIVANLAGNALRHGGPPVRVRVAATPAEALVEVTDGGPGLPPEVLPHVFARFWKRDPARARTPGSGLGLSIARENARLHGGDLTADADARFVLRLPRAVRS